jgi:hypothetical protein
LVVQPLKVADGSDHSKSHINDALGGSIGLLILFNSQISLRVGLNPPWTQKILFPTTAAMGSQSKVAQKFFHNLTLNFLLH